MVKWPSWFSLSADSVIAKKTTIKIWTYKIIPLNWLIAEMQLIYPNIIYDWGRDNFLNHLRR